MSEQAYLDLMRECLENGDRREGRNGITRSLFGRQIRFDLQQGFPLLTTKRIHWKSVSVELLWFLRGDTNVKYLHEHGVTIWDEWADGSGNLGPVYGEQWRHWIDSGIGFIDQISKVVHSLRTDPRSRRHIVTAWCPSEIDKMALPPCHMIFQFHVSNDGKLSCHLNQRSADVFLGVPFNIASYALLTHMMAREVGLVVGELIISFGDIHLYENHTGQAAEQLTRTPQDMPSIAFTDDYIGILDDDPSHIVLKDYNPLPAIKAPVSA